MAVRVTADPQDLEKLAADAGVAGDLLIEEVMEAVRYATLAGWGEAATKAPKFTGLLASSIKGTLPSIHQVGADNIQIEADFHTGAYEWSVVQEYSRRPNQTGPPFMHIWRWVDLMVKRGKFQLDIREGESYDDAIDRAVFLVVRKIAKYGTDAQNYMRAGEEEAEKYLERLVHRGVDTSVNRLVLNR